MDDVVVIDARGLNCPEPAMRTRQALKAARSERIEVLVDNATARLNCERMATSAGWRASVEDAGSGEFRLVLER